MEHPRKLLEQHAIHPKKSLGQNFLFDDSLLHKIVASADLDPADHVLEIGPGVGALTGVLAQAAARVVAVELDNRLLPLLHEQLAPYPHVELHHADILDLNPSDLFDRPYAAVANVPYYITGAIMRHLLSNKPMRPKRIVFTVQKEVAERMTAPVGKMSLLAVSTQFYGTASIVSHISAGAFWPKPKVASSIVRVDVSEQPPVNEKLFFRLAKAGFSQKRKQLKNNLRALQLGDDVIAENMAAVDIDGRRRAETLSVPEWRALTAQFATLVG